MTVTIQPLKKVTLSIAAGSASGTTNLTTDPVSLEFIHGIASGGISRFESALHGKKEGESLSVSVAVAKAHEFFGPFHHSLFQGIGLQIMPAKLFLEFTVMKVIDADNREVVQSLAKGLSGGCGGGSCDCGCG